MEKPTLALLVINILVQPLVLAFQEPTQVGWGVGQFVINLVAVVAAGVALYKYISSARRTLKKIEEALPTLFDIAKEFNPNAKDGDSLRHVIDDLTGNLSTLKAQAELLLETAEPPIFMSDKMGQITFVNNSWCALTGLNQEDSLGNGWTTAIHDEDRNRVYREWTQAIMDERPFFLEFRLVNEALHKVSFVRARTVGIADISRRHKGKLVAYIGQVKVLKTEQL